MNVHEYPAKGNNPVSYRVELLYRALIEDEDTDMMWHCIAVFVSDVDAMRFAASYDTFTDPIRVISVFFNEIIYSRNEPEGE